MLQKISVPMVLRALEKLYDPPKTFLHWRTPLDLLVATTLSAQCTDVRVNIVTKTLYKKYQKPEDYLRVSRQELEQDIHSCGTYHMKAKHIQELCGLLIEHHKGQVPDSMEELITLPGVGRKTASIILHVVFDKAEGIAVDTHVLRVAQRLGLTKHATPRQIELDLMARTPKKHWNRINTLLISHGRAVCTARNRRCQMCVFQKRCPSSVTRGKPDLARKSGEPLPRKRTLLG